MLPELVYPQDQHAIAVPIVVHLLLAIALLQLVKQVQQLTSINVRELPAFRMTPVELTQLQTVTMPAEEVEGGHPTEPSVPMLVAVPEQSAVVQSTSAHKGADPMENVVRTIRM